jgi:hypothetical protein
MMLTKIANILQNKIEIIFFNYNFKFLLSFFFCFIVFCFLFHFVNFIIRPWGPKRHRHRFVLRVLLSAILPSDNFVLVVVVVEKVVVVVVVEEVVELVEV